MSRLTAAVMLAIVLMGCQDGSSAPSPAPGSPTQLPESVIPIPSQLLSPTPEVPPPVY